MSSLALDRYQHEFEHVDLARDDLGILEVRLHSAGSDLVWGLDAHIDIANAWDCIARDPDNRVVILTGTGTSFISEGGVYADDPNWITPQEWKRIHSVGRRLVLSHLDIEAPMIAAVNGPATIHSEQALLCDIVIASDDAVFGDRVHFDVGVVPGDGIQVIWPYLIGLNRSRYMALMGQQFSADEAQQLGVVNEVVPKGDVLQRAQEIARFLAAKPSVALRSTRMLFTRDLRRLMSDGVDLGLMAEGLAGMEFWPGPPSP